MIDIFFFGMHGYNSNHKRLIVVETRLYILLRYVHRIKLILTFVDNVLFSFD